MPVKSGPVVDLGRAVCGNYSDASEREWLEANGRGGYALGTVAGGNTRRYHSLLTVPRRPPLERVQLVNRSEDALIAGDKRFDLSCQSYPDVVNPKGYDRLESFRLDPFPVWTYAWGDVRFEKSFFLRYGEDTAVAVYRLLAGPALSLEVRPFLTGRDHHVLLKESARLDGKARAEGGTLTVDFPDGPVLTVWADGGRFESAAAWYRNQTYVWEERRGLERQEDVWSPGFFRIPLKPGQTTRVVYAVGRSSLDGAERWEEEERDQRRKIVRASLVRGPLAGALTAAADQFIVSRGDGLSVIAGYPWFGDWSRDALVAFPGLFLATGRWNEAPGFLDTYARHVHEGLLPNRSPEGGESTQYNAVDAPLWFVRAVQAYHRATHDDDRARAWLPVMREIVDSYQHGNRLDIRMDQDGLIEIPPGDWPLTWMDARLDGKPVTPRNGKPVEIQALWYNALQFLVEIQLKLKEPTRGYDKLAGVARKSFNEKFWNEDAQCLFDVVDGKRREAELRPNGLLAVSLPYEILEERNFKPLVETTWWELLTPRGLRTLSPSHLLYRGRHGGPPADRDRMYHQGTVWPWLLGPFVTAYVKAFGSTEESKKQVVRFLQPLVHHLSEAGLGQVSEFFDGDAPHAPQGCPAQAWSVGEILRVLWEEGITL